MSILWGPWTKEELEALEQFRGQPVVSRMSQPVTRDERDSYAEALFLLRALHSALQDDFDNSADRYDMPRGRLGEVHEEVKAFLVRKNLVKP